MRLPRALLIIVLAVPSIGGCQDDDSKRAIAAVGDFVGALAAGDEALACNRLAEAGVSELLLAAVRGRVDPSGLDAPGAKRCEIVAQRLSDGAESRLSELRRSPVTGVVLEGDRASVRTEEGAYEAEEVDGRWRLTRFDPVVAVLTPGSARRRPVHLTVVRPKLEEPSLGTSLSGRTEDATVDINGSIEPPDASLKVVRASGARVKSVQSRDARFRIRVALQRGRNRILMRADAPRRDPIELAVELSRGRR